ncbi:GDSL-type esterase/lipase family protein [Flavobacterium algicola]|uniref:GDSL-type esterase/lipase family protein n=1 Tax=Flavobacterium algicola TaxID=556529 RepID=UPI001EFD2867|nr:GDSL-type esterase/lipase family protein [Flavobacterium algicola]MCG9793465.1 GDSL-type esterase/lipase family protein [Flavobacterium algicola]
MANPSINSDWAYLQKYQQENTALPSPLPSENRIVFIGDSITEFWSKEQPDFFSRKEYINRGISGQTSPQLLLRFRADVIQLKPRAVVILAGGNDIAGNTGKSTLKMIMDNIVSMVELAKANKIEVLLCSVLPSNYFYWNPTEKPAETIIALNQLIESYATDNDILFVNYYDALVDDKKGLPLDYSEDNVHPNKKGYLVMEPIITNAISTLAF